MESPLLYVLYVATLLTAVEGVDLRDGDVSIGGRRAPALMVADDLALVAYSQVDMQSLLDKVQSEYLRLLSKINLDKTRVVPFVPCESRQITVSADGECRMATRPGSRLRKYGILVTITYGIVNVLFATHYIYLGLIFGYRSTPADAWKARDSAAVKALGCLKACLTGFFFLPFPKICNLVKSLVFSVYLYGAELWAPFSGDSLIGKLAYGYIFGFKGNMKVQRMRGWFPMDDLGDLAVSKALRIIFEAKHQEGLLREVVIQYIRNFESAEFMRKDTWYGGLQVKVRKVWPRFEVHVSESSLIIRGVPFNWQECSGKIVADIFVVEAAKLARRTRYDSLLMRPPGEHQQDLVLHGLVLRLRQLNLQFCSYVFPALPDCPHYLVQDLLRFLSGTVGFARVTAHYELRHARRRGQLVPLPEYLKHACLLCALKSNSSSRSLRETPPPADTEWHLLFGCSDAMPARMEYKTYLMEHGATFQYPWGPTLESLVTHTLRSREDPGLLIAFMKCVSKSLSLRHKALSRISTSVLRDTLCPQGD